VNYTNNACNFEDVVDSRGVHALTKALANKLEDFGKFGNVLIKHAVLTYDCSVYNTTNCIMMY